MKSRLKWTELVVLIIVMTVSIAFLLLGIQLYIETQSSLRRDLVQTNAKIIKSVKREAQCTSGSRSTRRSYDCYDISATYNDQEGATHSFSQTRVEKVPTSGMIPVLYDKNDPTFVREEQHFENSILSSLVISAFGIIGITLLTILIIRMRKVSKNS